METQVFDESSEDSDNSLSDRDIKNIPHMCVTDKEKNQLLEDPCCLIEIPPLKNEKRLRKDQYLEHCEKFAKRNFDQKRLKIQEYKFTEEDKEKKVIYKEFHHLIQDNHEIKLKKTSCQFMFVEKDRPKDLSSERCRHFCNHFLIVKTWQKVSYSGMRE